MFNKVKEFLGTSGVEHKSNVIKQLEESRQSPVKKKLREIKAAIEKGGGMKLEMSIVVKKIQKS